MPLPVRTLIPLAQPISSAATPAGQTSALRERGAAGGLPQALLASFWNGLLLFSLLLALTPGSARAQAPDPLRILVLEGPTSDWVRRVRGQLSDLPVSIATLALVVEGQPEPELLRQLGPLAEHRDAALVAWLMTDRGTARAVPGGAAVSDESTRVGVWFARSGRFFSRPIGGAWTRLSASDRSGVLELGALSVRSAVRSLLLDPTQAEPFRDLEPAPGAVGTVARGGGSNTAGSGAAAPSNLTPMPASLAQPHPANAATPSPAVPPPNAAPPAALTPSAGTPAAPAKASTAEASAEAAAAAAAQPSGGSAPPSAVLPQDGPIVTSPRAAPAATDVPSGAASVASAFALDLHGSLELGAIGQIPGPPAYGAFGFEAGVRARDGAWGALLLGQLGVPLRSKLGPDEITLVQHALLVEGQYLRWNDGAWSFGPLARVGMRWARRETVSGDLGPDAAAVAWQHAVRFGLGWGTELRWGTRFGATLRGVLHWEPVRPRYAVLTTAGDSVSRAQPWAVQPSLELSGNWYW